nr:unnamed protein product [Callosobruchus analis]
MRNGFLEPVMTILPPAPDELLNTILCNRMSGCVAYETDLNEDRTFDLEIMKELETNVIEDDNEDNNELEILELREDDDDEEDEN